MPLLKHETIDNSNFDLHETIEKINHDNEYLTNMVANMAAIEHSEDAIIGIDCEGTILNWNSGASKMYGYSKTAALGKVISIIMPLDFHEELNFILDNTKKNSITRYETIRNTQDGDEIDVSVTLSTIKNSEHNICGATIIDRNIYKQREAEEALIESEEKYQEFFDEDLAANFVANIEGKLLECNDSFLKTYGFETVELAKEAFISDFNPDDWAYLIEKLETEQKILGHRTIHFRPDDEKLNILANIVGIFDESDQLTQIKGYIFNVTEQVNAEEALQILEEKYSQLYDENLTANFTATLQGKIVECNQSFAETYGDENLENAKKTNISDLNPDDWKYLVQTLKNTPKIQKHQTTHYTPDGKEMDVVANIVGIFNQYNMLIQIKGYIFEKTP